jgi:hypothetical protein
LERIFERNTRIIKTVLENNDLKKKMKGYIVRIKFFVLTPDAWTNQGSLQFT